MNSKQTTATGDVQTLNDTDKRLEELELEDLANVRISSEICREFIERDSTKKVLDVRVGEETDRYPGDDRAKLRVYDVDEGDGLARWDTEQNYECFRSSQSTIAETIETTVVRCMREWGDYSSDDVEVVHNQTEFDVVEFVEQMLK